MIINLFIIRHGESLSNKNRDLFYPEKINLSEKFFRLIKSVNYEPILSLRGIKQSKQLKKNLNEIDFDLYICSNLMRSIMTGIFAIDYSKEIIIFPFINEHLNFLGTFDKSNKMNNYSNLKLKIEYLNNWLLSREILSPNINLEIYNNKTKNLLEDEYISPNFEKFIEILNKYIKNKNYNKDELNICLISHGTFIRKEINKYFKNEELDRKLENTEIIKYTYKLK